VTSARASHGHGSGIGQTIGLSDLADLVPVDQEAQNEAEVNNTREQSIMSITKKRVRSPAATSAVTMDQSNAVQVAAAYLLRYGLGLVIAWIGFMKFTAYEAAGIQPLVAHSPLMSWVYAIFSERAFSVLLGVAEVAIAAMICLRSVSAKVSAIGSGLAAVIFLTTLTFLFSTPGWEPSLGGFPALSAMPGQFLLKDLVLLAAALWSLGEVLPEALQGRGHGDHD
jgi:uncharacterized membrane protein YkgB